MEIVSVWVECYCAVVGALAQTDDNGATRLTKRRYAAREADALVAEIKRAGTPREDYGDGTIFPAG